MPDFSPRLETFIQRHVRSLWQLELILSFARSCGPLSLAEVSRELYMDPAALESTVVELVNTGLIRKVSAQEKFEFSPKDSTVVSAIAEAEEAYKDRPTALIDLIYRFVVRDLADAHRHLSDSRME